MRTKRAQVAIEFTILLTVMFLVFLSFLGVIYQKTYDVAQASDRQLLEQVGDKISIEIDAAAFAEDGFQHKFNIPVTILGKVFEINFCPKYEYYTDDVTNCEGYCGITKPEISLNYKGETLGYINKIPLFTVGVEDSLMDPTTKDISAEICLRKENGALYINHPDCKCGTNEPCDMPSVCP